MVEITVNGKKYEGFSKGGSMRIAVYRAMQRWRGKRYNHYDEPTKKNIYTKGPGFGMKGIKEMNIKVTEEND